MRKKVFITGINGQDGSYLARKLIKLNYSVYGLIRRGSTNRLFRLDYFNITKRIKFFYGELNEYQLVQDIILSLKPDFIFNLAAQSFVKYSFDNPIYTYEINTSSVLNMLECLRKNKLNKTRFYNASTSEMFGNTVLKKGIINEKTPMNPCSPYGSSKASAYNLVKIYRESYNLFVCSGILFNHESPLRGEEFVTRKIVKNLVRQKYGSDKILNLGNLNSQRDWGHAEDYVDAMYKMLKNTKPQDYVIGTGTTTTVKEFLKKVLKKLDFDFEFKSRDGVEYCYNKKNNKKIMQTNKKYFRENELNYLKADSSLAKKDFKWTPKHNIDSLIDDMILFEKKSFED